MNGSGLRHRAEIVRGNWGLSVSLAAISATLAYFQRAIFTDQVFISRDIQRVYYPFKQYWAERVSRLEFPDWFPYEGLGEPFPGMVISGVFHPTNLLYLVAPLGAAMKLNILLCYPLAFGGAYLFARRLELPREAAALAAVLFAFNGYMVTITNNLLYLMAAATFPWALWAADRYFARPSLLKATGASLASAMVLFAGDSQSFVVCCSLVALLGLLRSAERLKVRLARVAMLSLLTGLMAAVQIIPALSVVAESGMSGRGLDVALIWSLHPLRLIEMAIGPLFGGEGGDADSVNIAKDLLSSQNTTLWVDSVHFGALAVALAGIGFWSARRNRLAWVALLGATGLLTLALGKHAGLYAVVYQLVPLWRPFRYPEKLLPYLFFIGSIAAGFGAAALQRDEIFRKRVAASFAVAALVLLGLGVAEHLARPFAALCEWAWNGSIRPGALSRVSSAFRFFSLESGVVVALGAAALWLVRHGRLRTGIVGLLAFGNLLSANEGLYELTFPEVLTTPSSFVQVIRSREGPAKLGGMRIFSGVDKHYLPPIEGMNLTDLFAVSVPTALEPVTPALHGLESSNNYLPAASDRFMKMFARVPMYFGRFSGLFSTRYITVSMQFYSEIGGNADAIIAEHPQMHMLLLQNPLAKPRAYLALPRCVASREEAMALLMAKDAPLDRYVVVECGKREEAVAEPPGDLGTVEVIAYQPERVELKVRAKAAAAVVLTDAFYKGWSATLDEREVPILPANHAVRAVLVPEGEHVVTFRYRTPGLLAGFAVSVLSLLAGVIGGWALKRRARSS